MPEETNGKLIDLSKRRARNSIIAFHHRSNPAIVEARGLADTEWGRQQQEHAATLPEGDTMRETVEFIGYLDVIAPIPWLTPPPKVLGTLGDAWPDPKKTK